MKHNTTGFLTLLFAALLGSAATALAEGEGGVEYVKITEDMVVNYGDPSLNRLNYLKVAIHARVADASAADMIEYHLPALRDALIMLLSAQHSETVRSAEGKEEIRLMVLKKMQKLLKAEENEEYITDVLFSRFVVQR
ncbi:MAG: flagellar basal body-associated FliL family protein [Pseudomonadales bacterium]|nr:flagellar basal body-associated FliL family protein [Pseudomonadales bacterium]